MEKRLEVLKEQLERQFEELGGLAPLYIKLGYSIHPQPAYLRLDEDGEARLWVNHQSDGTPESVWNGRAVLWSLHPRLSREALNRLVEDERVLDLLARVHDGRTVEWDGRNNVGRYTDDASAASQELIEYLDQQYNDEVDNLIDVIDAGEYIWDAHTYSIEGLRAVWPPEQLLDEVVSELEEEAEQLGYLINGDIREVLLEALDDLVGDDDPADVLTGEHLREYERFSSEGA